MAVASIAVQEEILFEADCGAGDSVGEFVFISGVVSGKKQVSQADPSDSAKMPSMGAIVEKPTSTTCVIKRVGEAAVFSGLTIGKTYFVGAGGLPVLVAPSGIKQVVGISSDTTKMLLENTIDIAGVGALWVEDEFTASAAQVTFILSQAPSDVNSITVLVNGVVYDDGTDYTVSGATVTWLNNSFAMEAGEQVFIRYV